MVYERRIFNTLRLGSRRLRVTEKAMGVTLLLALTFFYITQGNFVENTRVALTEEKNVSPRDRLEALCNSSIMSETNDISGRQVHTSVHSNGVQEFSINVYGSDDAVSNEILQSGWENDKIAMFNHYFTEYSKEHNLTLSELTFVDVGANVGWFSLNMAALGVDVLAFEPMEDNLNLIRQSLCIPTNIESGVSERITLFEYGLGEKEETCVIYSDDRNFGDGHTQCVEDENDLEIPPGHSVRGRIPVHRLDDVLSAEGRNVVVVKMDTEGHEGKVFKGGAEFLLNTGVPVLTLEFVPEWLESNGDEPLEILKSFTDAGYNLTQENREGFVSNEEMMNLDNYGLGKDLTFLKYAPGTFLKEVLPTPFFYDSSLV